MSWLQRISSPILTDELGQHRTFYHGTDEKFDEFEHRPGKRYILFSEHDVNAPGHFFSETEEEASQYGRNIMNRKLNVDKLLLDPHKFPHMSVDRFPDELEEELRYILAPMIQESEDGKWLEVGMRTSPVKDDEWIYELVGTNGLLWDVLDNPGVVQRMQERGYDGTYVDEGEGQRSVFVLDNQQIVQ